MSSYRHLLRTRGAAAFFLTAAVGRVGIAMTGLGLVWLLHARTGSYGTAGLAGAGFAVAEALAGPQVARLVDRYGQTRVLPAALLAHGTAVAGVLAAGTPAAAVVAATCAGAAVPQLGALSAARWAYLLRAERAAELPAAFSLESLANATAFLLGPVLVTALGAAGHPALASTLAAALIVGGGAALATQHHTAPPPAPTHAARARTRTNHAARTNHAGRTDRSGRACRTDRSGRADGDHAGRSSRSSRAGPDHADGGHADRAGRDRVGGDRGDRGHAGRASGTGTLLRPGFLVLVALNVAVGLYFGTMSVAVSAFATGHGTPGAAAPIIAASSLGGLLAGWLYGLRRYRAPARRQLVVAAAWLTGAGLLLPLVPSAPWLGVASVVTEAAVPPTLVLLNVLTERAVHPAALTQAFTWNNSASAAGSALAAFLAGRAADAWGASAALAQAPVAGGVLLVLALVLAARRARPTERAF